MPASLIGSAAVAMDQWRDKVAVVTGASSGIGEAVVRTLCTSGVCVVGLARREARLRQLEEELNPTFNGRIAFTGIQCDITKEEEIQRAFGRIKASFGGVDIMINNAGSIRYGSLLGDRDNLSTLTQSISTNVTGLISCTKKAFDSMAERNVPGFIINISSVAGHYVPQASPPLMNIYPPTKHAIRALNSVLRHELLFMGRSNIRVSTISPGIVDTELFAAGGLNLKDFGADLPMLKPQDITRVLLFILASDPSVHVEDVVIRPTGDAF